MQGCRTEGYEGCECKDARLKDTKDRGCSLVHMPRSLVARLQGTSGYIYIYIYIYIHMNMLEYIYIYIYIYT